MRDDDGMGRLFPTAGAGIALARLGGTAAAGLALALLGGTAGATTTTTRPRPPGVFTPSVSPSTIDNQSGCSHSTAATVSTGTTGDARKVTFKVQVSGRITTLYASGSGSRWSATFNGSAFGPDHGSGTVRATATGPGGSTESGPGSFTITDCPA
ncbi:MAG TPA: hypothetical protein VG034_20840 [Acidimicrobiia bacterium]|nr:hypothetical protein [Acidimicrobiia bacterium]